MRSESWKFIWQPKVSIRYLFAMGSRILRQFADFRFRLLPFALSGPGHFRPGVEQFAGTGPNLLGNGGAANHTRDFFDSPVFVEPTDACHRAAPTHGFFNRELRRSARRDLWQVRDAQDLEPLPQRLQSRTDDVSDAAADTGIDLVEDQRLAWRVFGRQRLQRQHNPRELATGDDARQRPEILARVRRHEELRLVDTAFAPRRLGKVALVEPDLETRSGHRELREQRLEVARKCDGRRSAFA